MLTLNCDPQWPRKKKTDLVKMVFVTWCTQGVMCEAADVYQYQPMHVTWCHWFSRRCFIGRLKMTVVSLFLILSGLIPEPGIELSPWTQKKWILLAPNSQIIFRTMQWFLCVCFVSAFRECKISFRYHEFSEEKVKRWTARGIQNQDRVFWRLKSWLCCWKVRKCMKMLWRNDLLPETIEMKVDFCVKLTTKSTKADAKDQDQCSEIHRITW